MLHQPFDQMPDTIVSADPWRRLHIHEQMTLNHWQQGHDIPIPNLHDADFRIFHGDYEDSMHNDGGPLISPPMGYVPETSWASDVDMGSPSTAAFPGDPSDAYHTTRHTANHHLHIPPRHERITSSVHSPRSLYGGLSPHTSYAKLQETSSSIREERPNLTRSITAPAAPDHRPRRAPNTSGTPSIKRSGSEDEDDEYVPSEEIKPRGRKRQRIPHTAVERRYRENLNAHLDKLRQTVPSLASKRSAGASKPGDGLGEGVKPSKCEILNGAIEHIGALGKENSALHTEVQALRSRLEDLESWCGGAAAQGYGK
ncbi:uncharacterized protein MYCFIDRAFT_210195 [Pseudocercospora fijiensis CIRAD86]|uniref:BHLH domain-containing protein n=1 Tax=Pseudocercospora fijiensis (strain CIRAD86) TaxID=383855 RepID=M2Z6B2_PSEFD|nr:uncharacterized protein MYCFIDRAFT_210195 [Pseudocercospora fijiensis CIRAD86]EME85300.1 hypothetical protein MYCFIDRAFT_210195 [Pseudocercospora fijiensis CIRAD86]